jgi:hypothetical protein
MMPFLADVWPLASTPRSSYDRLRTEVSRSLSRNATAPVHAALNQDQACESAGGFVGLGPKGDEGVLRYAKETEGRSRLSRRAIASLVASPTGLEPVCFKRNMQ